MRAAGRMEDKMRLTELLNTEQVTISCELFPPKKGTQLDNYKKIVADTGPSAPPTSV